MFGKIFAEEHETRKILWADVKEGSVYSDQHALKG
jgi:hypothetical protein